MASTYKTPNYELSQFILSDKLKMNDYNTDMLNIDAKTMPAAKYDPTGEVAEAGGILGAARDIMEELANEIKAHIAPTGQITPFGGDTAPSGWLLCDGSEVSRTEHEALFDVIGTIYGEGDELTTFNLPDLVDRFPLGCSEDLGTTGGSATNSLPLGDHGYPLFAHGQSALFSKVINSTVTPWNATGTSNLSRTSTSSAVNSAVPLAGRTEEGSTMPPYLSLNYIIKA